MKKVDYSVPGCKVVSASTRRVICASIYGVGSTTGRKGLDSYEGESLD